MNKKLFSLSLVLTGVALFMPGRIMAAVTVDATNPQLSFVPIFDSQALNGWHIMQKPADDSYYATEENFFVRGRVITCFQKQPDQKGGLLLSDGEYGDFELSLDFKNDWGCDSGVLLRCTERGQGIQVLNDYFSGGCMGFILGQGTGGVLFCAVYYE